MPIGDLLASITGQPSAPSPTTTAQPNLLPKRKADSDIRQDASKAPRTTAPQSRPVQPSRPLDRPSVNSKPTISNVSKPSVLSAKASNGISKVTKPASGGRPSAPPNSGAGATLASRAPPKKGSYAEILARASKAQAVMGQVGKIQHKKVEGGAIKKEKEARIEQRAPPLGKRAPTGYSGSASKNGPVRPVPIATNGRSRDDRAAPAPRTPKLSAKQQAELERERQRQARKAAQPTSGYAGTARGRPATTSKKPNAAPRGGALLAAPKARHGSSHGSRYDEEDDYDEELDDFIEYDDDEEEQGGGPRYEYASDASSDMEAGLDDIDEEESRTAKIARQEDLKEQRLEAELKEAKRRRQLEELRARKRR